MTTRSARFPLRMCACTCVCVCKSVSQSVSQSYLCYEHVFGSGCKAVNAQQQELLVRWQFLHSRRLIGHEHFPKRCKSKANTLCVCVCVCVSSYALSRFRTASPCPPPAVHATPHLKRADMIAICGRLSRCEISSVRRHSSSACLTSPDTLTTFAAQRRTAAGCRTGGWGSAVARAPVLSAATRSRASTICTSWSRVYGRKVTTLGVHCHRCNSGMIRSKDAGSGGRRGRRRGEWSRVEWSERSHCPE